MSSQPTLINILDRFKKSCIKFIDELIEQFPNEQDLIVTRVVFDNQLPVNVIADSFILHVLPHKQMIIDRNENFFLENDNIFGMLDSSKVLHFKKLWVSNKLDDDDRTIIWKWFDTFCSLVEAYQKLK